MYSFDHKHRKPPMGMKDLLGGKGANLAEMTSVLKLPVPPGFTISTDACREYMKGGWPAGLDDEIAAQVTALESKMGRALGDPNDPLLVSVRSGAKFSMPGMMDTVLNLGLNDKSVKGLAKATSDERFAYDSYRRFISMYGRIVLGIDGEAFEHPLEALKTRLGTKNDAEIPASELKSLCEVYKQAVKEATGKAFPQQPMKQLRGAVEAVFKSWNGARAIAYRVRERISHDLGTAVNVQAMVFGNRDETSGTGVGFTPQRRDWRGASRTATLSHQRPRARTWWRGSAAPRTSARSKVRFEIHAELLAIFARLERHYQVHVRHRVHHRTGQALDAPEPGSPGAHRWLRVAHGRGDDQGQWQGQRPLEDLQESLILRVTAEHLDSVLHPTFASAGKALAKGLGASPGAAVGAVCFTPTTLWPAQARSEAVVLVRNETRPERARHDGRQGILTARGGLVSHARPSSPGLGTPAVVGAEAIKIREQEVQRRRHRRQGRRHDLDRRRVRRDRARRARTEERRAARRVRRDPRLGRPDPQGQAGRAGQRRQRSDSISARNFGAEGVGLCRTEHMFLAEDRHHGRSQDDPRLHRGRGGRAARSVAPGARPTSSDPRAMDGLPVTVRLLGPPLHEFLPSVERSCASRRLRPG
ncbi:MAG: PEP/pyruvate-binding domain-containing protein [Ilumatobacteraceae bacterium]